MINNTLIKLLQGYDESADIIFECGDTDEEVRLTTISEVKNVNSLFNPLTEIIIHFNYPER